MKKEHLVRFHQQNILAAAEKLFSEKGMCQTTMDDISRAAEYSKSTIYVYFHSKDEIYNYIIHSYMCSLRDTLRDCIRETRILKAGTLRSVTDCVPFMPASLCILQVYWDI